MDMRIQYWQVAGPMKAGDYVIDIDSCEIRKCNMIDEIPIGIVKNPLCNSKIIVGDKVAVELIWQHGYLRKNIKIGDALYCMGQEYKVVKIMVDGGTWTDYVEKRRQEYEIDGEIHKLKKKKEELWK